MSEKINNTSQRPIRGGLSRAEASAVMYLARIGKVDLSIGLTCDILGVPTKTRNHDLKDFSAQAISQVDEGKRTVPFEREASK